MIPHLGSLQLRNLVSFVGNVASGWYLSDLSICFMVTNSYFLVTNVHGEERSVEINNGFFLGDNKVNLSRNDVITGVCIPMLQTEDKMDKFFYAKQGQRHGHDNAIVNCACRFTTDTNNQNLYEAAFAFGGVANRPYMVVYNKQSPMRKNEVEVFQNILKFVENELETVVDRSHPKVEYRITLALSFVSKFLMLLDERLPECAPKFEAIDALQLVPELLSGQPLSDPVGRPMMHNSSEKHTTGQSVFLDDISILPNELHLALVLSDHAHALIKSVDVTEACRIPGVVSWIDVNDIPTNGSNTPGAPVIDTRIFSDGEVTSCGEAIGAIAAENSLLARRAAKLVKIGYEDLPAVLSIEEAFEKKYVYETVIKCSKGDIERGFAECDNTIIGQVKLNGQEHFYMEPQSCIVIPKDGDEYEIISSTQAPGWIHKDAARALGIAAHKVVVKVKRIGGGFGGKTYQSYVAAWPAFIAAHKLRRPVRHVLTREEDMTISGKRPEYLAKYKVGVTKDGTINAMHITVLLNAGCNIECSTFMIHHCITNIDNGYHVPHMELEGIACKTNHRPSTGFRGAGQTEAHFLSEAIMQNVAQALNVDAVQLRRKHLYKDGDVTLHGYPVSNCTLERCWDECLRISQYNFRVTEIETYNRQNARKKRGIAVTTVKYGVGELSSPIEQGGVLVNIYLDGSVLINHGGVEMGQGLTPKLIQVASRVLKVPPESVTSIDVATDKIPNAVVTAASIGTDVYALAVKEACEILLQRLEPYAYKNPKGTLAEWVCLAHADRIDLSARGFGRPTGDNPDGKAAGKPRYFVYGVGCVEAEVDCLTGDHYLRSCDLVLDIGQTINPALDIGQIEGGFTQGYGLVSMEELIYDRKGKLLTNTAFTYKIPSVTTVPRKFTVAILQNGVCRDNIYSSKGIGEPPFSLGFGGFFAVVNAVTAARREAGISEEFHLDAPATPEKIRLACPKVELL